MSRPPPPLPARCLLLLDNAQRGPGPPTGTGQLLFLGAGPARDALRPLPTREISFLVSARMSNVITVTLVV